MNDDELRKLYEKAEFTAGNFAGLKCLEAVPALLDRLAAMRGMLCCISDRALNPGEEWIHEAVDDALAADDELAKGPT